MLRIRRPPETVIAIHLFAGHKLGQTNLPGVVSWVAVLVLHTYAVDGGDTVGERLVAVLLIAVQALTQRGFLGICLYFNAVVQLTFGHFERFALSRPIANVDQHQVGAGGVQHMLAVWGDARVEHRRIHCRILVQPFAGQLAGATGRRASCSIVANLRQKQPTIDGEHHAITIGVNGIAHDASAAFTGTFAACFLLGRHIFAISGSAQ